MPLTLKKGEYKPALKLSKEIRDKLSEEWHGQMRDLNVTLRFETFGKVDFVGFYKESDLPFKFSSSRVKYVKY